MSSMTRACCGQNVIPGSVLGGGGRGDSLAGRAPSARRLCGAQGVWAEPQQPQATLGQPLASPRWLWGLPVGGPCQVTFRWHCPGSAAGPMSTVLGPRGGNQEALFTAILSVPSLLGGLRTRASARTDPSHQALFSAESRVSPLQGGYGGRPCKSGRVGPGLGAAAGSALGARLITAPHHRAWGGHVGVRAPGHMAPQDGLVTSAHPTWPRG